jgi:hypothetical protein
MCCLYYTVLQLEIFLLHKSGDLVRCRTPHTKWHLYIPLTVYVLPDAQECVLLNISEVQWSCCALNLHIYYMTIHFVFYTTPKMKAQRHETISIMLCHTTGPPLPIHWPDKTHIPTIMKQNEKMSHQVEGMYNCCHFHCCYCSAD